ncbi:hypothetical protein PINS_up017203 [Pythium insidiosum]|nr:hypothetical protein PINS_up017203 [Pythium insidiosum]
METPPSTWGFLRPWWLSLPALSTLVVSSYNEPAESLRRRFSHFVVTPLVTTDSDVDAVWSRAREALELAALLRVVDAHGFMESTARRKTKSQWEDFEDDAVVSMTVQVVIQAPHGLYVRELLETLCAPMDFALRRDEFHEALVTIEEHAKQMKRQLSTPHVLVRLGLIPGNDRLPSAALDAFAQLTEDSRSQSQSKTCQPCRFIGMCSAVRSSKTTKLLALMDVFESPSETEQHFRWLWLMYALFHIESSHALREL